MNKQVCFWRNKLIVAVAIIIFGLLVLPAKTSAIVHVDSGQVENHDDTHESLDEVITGVDYEIQLIS